jgi:mono/diheme cytochrome c family protein
MAGTFRLKVWMLAPVLAVGACATTPSPAVELPADLPTVNADFRLNNDLAAQGEVIFERKGCGGCHGALGSGRMGGPDLLGVVERREVAWLHSFLKDTETMLQSDPIAMALLEEYRHMRMPNMNLSDNQIDALVHYLAAESQRVRARKGA